MSPAAGGEHLQHQTEMKCQVPSEPGHLSLPIYMEWCHGGPREGDWLHVLLPLLELAY